MSVYIRKEWYSRSLYLPSESRRGQVSLLRSRSRAAIGCTQLLSNSLIRKSSFGVSVTVQKNHMIQIASCEQVYLIHSEVISTVPFRPSQTKSCERICSKHFLFSGNQISRYISFSVLNCKLVRHIIHFAQHEVGMTSY